MLALRGGFSRTYSHTSTSLPLKQVPTISNWFLFLMEYRSKCASSMFMLWLFCTLLNYFYLFILFCLHMVFFVLSWNCAIYISLTENPKSVAAEDEVQLPAPSLCSILGEGFGSSSSTAPLCMCCDSLAGSQTRSLRVWRWVYKPVLILHHCFRQSGRFCLLWKYS